MGSLPPVSDSLKTKLDIAAIGTGAASFFHAIPWSEIAGFLSVIYLVLRIGEMLWSWVDKP